MNPTSFANHGGPMPAGHKPLPQMQGQQKNESTHVLLKHVMQTLQAQGTFTGWRERVSIQERAMKVYQMFCSLRLIPKVDPQSALNAAMKFEERAFRESREKVDYDREYTEKLAQIRDTRQQRAMMIQNGMLPQSGPPGGIPTQSQNQMQSVFPQQLQRPIQGSPIPIQQPQQMMGMNVPNQQIPMQHQAFLQNPQQRAASGPVRDELSALSPQEFQNVCRLADQMARKTPQADLEKIKMNLQNMPPEQRQALVRKGLEPLTYFFRMQALKEIRKQRLARMGMLAAHAQNVAKDAGNSVITDSMMNPLQRQMAQPLIGAHGHSTIPVNGQPGLDPTFVGSIDHIQGQQADGLRSQEAGQLVVPASTPQMMNQQFGSQQAIFQGGQQTMNRSVVNPTILAQQQHQGIQNVQQEKLQHAVQFQAQSARAQAAAKAQMAMSSQANPQMSHSMAQQSPQMPILNRPIGPGQIAPLQVGPQGRPPSRPPGLVPEQAAVPNPRPPLPPGAPLVLQEQLAQMSPEQATAALANYQRRGFPGSQAMSRPNQQSLTVQQPIPQLGQPPQLRNGHLIGDPNIRTSMVLQPQPSSINGVPAQHQIVQGQHMSIQPQQQRQQPSDPRVQYLRQHNIVAMNMTNEQIVEMDRMPFPPAILNANSNMTPPLPKNVKTWGQLKQWVAQNPHILGDVNLPKLLDLQRLHFIQSLNARRGDASRNPDHIRQNHSAALPMGPTQQPTFNLQQGFQPGLQTIDQQQARSNVPVMRPITANEIHLARQKLGPQGSSFSDEGLRQLLEKNRQKQLLQNRNKAAIQAFPPQALNQGQPPQHPSAQHLQTSAPLVQQQLLQHSPQTQALRTGGGKTPVPSGSSASRPPNVKQTPKNNLKRPHSDEAVEVRNPNPQQQPQPPPTQTLTAPANFKPGVTQVTREQLAAMTPEQRAQLEAHLRRQQTQTRQPITKAVADEAWNHLPDRIKHVYSELSQNAPAASSIALTPEQTALMSQQLRDNTDMLGRMDALVNWLAKIQAQEKNVRNLLQMRMLLMKQFKGPDWTLADRFTITPDYLNSAIIYLKKWFAAMISQVQGSRQNQAGASSRPTVPQVPTGQSSGQGNIPLNASNLQQLEQQQEALQRARRAQAQAVPPAPTTLQPPFPLGAASPQGVPHAYGPSGLSPDKLSIPINKRRKQTQSANKPSTSAQPQTGPSPTAQAPKQAEAETKKSAPRTSGPFRCTIPGCQYYTKGLASQAALETHVAESHKAGEPIADALEFALESFRVGLGIDHKDVMPEEQEPKGRAATVQEAQRPQSKSNTTPKSWQEIKTEAATPGTTPMGRALSHVGLKSASPASSNVKTPQLSSARGTGLSNLNPTASKDGKKDTGKTTEQGSPAEASLIMRDLWADSSISPETLRAAFGDLGDHKFPGLGPDPVDEFLASEMFTRVRSKDTPQSTDTGVNTQTPKDSDISRDDEQDVNAGSTTDDNWIPSDWVNLPEHLDEGLLMHEPWEKINWDAIEDKDLDVEWDDGNMVIYSV